MNWLLEQLPMLADQWGPHLLVLFFALVLAGSIGLPMPEDLPLLALGYLAFRGVIPLWVLLPAALLAVLLGDWVLYGLGRRYGIHLTRIIPFRLFLTPARLARAQAQFDANAGKALFVGRFLPGVRSAVFFTAGHFRLPFWKMLVFDGGAALISVPAIVLAAYFFGQHLDQARHWTHAAQFTLMAVILAALACVVLIKLYRKHGAVHRATPLPLRRTHPVG